MTAVPAVTAGTVGAVGAGGGRVHRGYRDDGSTRCVLVSWGENTLLLMSL
ncbi:hypothetical protein HMPREF0290_1148 [Corynebacterium efficiens YS-314]|nr:hypothetical protein HMPREF0290_1148 [Corynebacterium efficiens YS-314]